MLNITGGMEKPKQTVRIQTIIKSWSKEREAHRMTQQENTALDTRARDVLRRPV
jgi:hypothetical protein